MNNAVLVVDANYLSFRSLYGGGKINLSYGEDNTTLPFLFLRSLLLAMRMYDTNRVVFCWDSKKSLRREIFPQYKANRRRERTEEEEAEYAEFKKQVRLLRKVILPNSGWSRQICQTGYEADDLMASIAFNNDGAENIVLISSDQDLYQCLIPGVCIETLRSGSKRMDQSRFTQKFSIHPKQWTEVKSIAGCTTDGVPGCPGIGEKTAISYLLGELPKGKKLDKIEAWKASDGYTVTKQLVSLPFPGTKSVPTFRASPNPDGFRRVCKEFGFKSLLKEEMDIICRGMKL